MSSTLYIAQFRSIAINDGSGTSYSYSGSSFFDRLTV